MNEITIAPTTAEEITPSLPLPQDQKPGQIDRLYERRNEMRKELAILDGAIAALEANPQIAALLTVVTRAIGNRGDY